MVNDRLGPYRLVERLGVGGMAEVFLARARREGGLVQRCVVKVLHRDVAEEQKLTRMLLDEARLVARLRHNNIASLYDVGREGDDIFLVMEYVAGRDLHSILVEASRRDRQIPIAFGVHVARSLCRGLHFAHTRRDPDGDPLELVHRDVSPPNVLVSTAGEIKLIDFGIAKFNSELRHNTSAGVIKGKFGYMSPEQAWDEPLDRRSDIFSLGVCLYEMLTGRALYGRSDDRSEMLDRARAADIEPVQRWRNEVPDELAGIVHRALQADPEDRYQWAHHIERDLAAFQAEHAPDYTPLDAGAFADELFDFDEPALQRRRPRLEEPDDEPGRNDDAVEQADPSVRPPEADRSDERIPPGTDDDTRPFTDAEDEETDTTPMGEVPAGIRSGGSFESSEPFDKAVADDEFEAGDTDFRVGDTVFVDGSPTEITSWNIEADADDPVDDDLRYGVFVPDRELDDDFFVADTVVIDRTGPPAEDREYEPRMYDLADDEQTLAPVDETEAARMAEDADIDPDADVRVPGGLDPETDETARRTISTVEPRNSVDDTAKMTLRQDSGPNESLDVRDDADPGADDSTVYRIQIWLAVLFVLGALAWAASRFL